MLSSQTIEELWRSIGIDMSYIESRGLCVFQEPQELVVVVEQEQRKLMLEPDAAKAWKALESAAESDAVKMYLISGFRSYEYQCQLLQKKLRAGVELTAALQILAPPGCSEHHTGRAVDIGAPGFAGLDEAFEESPAFLWMKDNGRHFGFSLSFPRNNRWGFIYEPWHWCFNAQSKDTLDM